MIWRQTAPYPICAIDYKGIWFGRSIQGGLIKPEYKDSISYEYLCGILNSSYIREEYENAVKEEGRVFPQVKLEKLKPLPIVIPTIDDRKKIERIVVDIIKNRQNRKEIGKLKENLDNAVYSLYKQ